MSHQEFMDLEFSAADLTFTTDLAYKPADLQDATKQYIALIRKYHRDLGDDEAKQRLADKASDVEKACPPCADRLDRARETL